MPRNLTAERGKDRIRQQRRRDKLAAARRPTTHTINRALVDALFQCLEVNRQEGRHRMLTPVNMAEVMYRAIAILTLGENKTSSFDVCEVQRAVWARMKKRPDASRTRRTTERMERDDITPLPLRTPTLPPQMTSRAE